MNLTLTQSHHRTQSLSGEIKAARSALADCEADALAKERIASIAVEAVDKAKANLAALEQEREDLADHIAGLVRQVGEDRELEETHGAHFADFGHPAQNGTLDQTAMNTAFDAARTPQ